MNIIYLISAVVIFKLIVLFIKRINVNAEEINYSCDNIEPPLENKSSTENTLETKSSMENIKDLGKNKWLFPDDEFIKHKNPKHYKAKNYKI